MEEIIVAAKHIVASIVQALVDRSECVDIQVEIASNILLIRVAVDASETGKVIGKGGRNASALRAIMGAFGARNKLKSIVEIEEYDRHNS